MLMGNHVPIFVYSILLCSVGSFLVTAQQRASPFVGRPSNLFSAKIHSVDLNQALCDQVNGPTHVEGTNASGLLFVCGNKISGEEKKKKVFYFLIKSLKSIFLEYYQMEAVWLLSLLLLLMMMKIMMASVDDEVQLSRH